MGSVKQLNLPVRNSQVGFLLIVLMQQPPRLPLMRELSAKLTEGEILYRVINMLTYTTEVLVNIQVANSYYR